MVYRLSHFFWCAAHHRIASATGHSAIAAVNPWADLGLASLGVYLRDVSQFVGIFTTVLMFLSPIFYPASALPEKYRPTAAHKPSLPSDRTDRDSIILGKSAGYDHFDNLSCWAAALVAWLGFAWFQKTRKGFADVL